MNHNAAHNTTHNTNCVIIGAGPVGLFQIFELGLVEVSPTIIDSLPIVGGQCSYLYPDKPIYDIPAAPAILARDLTSNLVKQNEPFDHILHLKTTAQKLEELPNGNYVLTCNDISITTKTIVIASGLGAFAPRKLRQKGIERYEEKNLFYKIQNKESLVNKSVCICGGGDSAIDWALELHALGCNVSLIHRREEFRAAPANVQKLKALQAKNEISITIGSITGYVGSNVGSNTDTLGGLEVGDTTVSADVFCVFYGLLPKLGPIGEFGLEQKGNQIIVNTETFATSRRNIFAVGDCNSYPGKRKLILSGFHETALAAHAIERIIYPERKQFNQYTTTSTALQKRLKVST